MEIVKTVADINEQIKKGNMLVVDTETAAAYVGVSYQTMYNWKQKYPKLCPIVKNGRKAFWIIKELEPFIQKLMEHQRKGTA